ncbi:MAG: corrinoid protein [Anaerolineales bacterium]|jgi:5-methyltetrahydrofolate--homocysteine methyltransferase|nr:corrinoid protein [Anaerolineales bacterium]HJL69491.1 corrinoid protein [Anaerolineales bacterium]|tara:strand:+ start:18619 stop:19260 length:642 start_codon:yes stop_codon:yes gene_type:complete
MADTYQEIASSLYRGDASKVAELVREAIDKNLDVSEILSDGLMKGMDKVGQDFKTNVIYVPEVLAAARAMQTGMNLLRPFLVKGEVKGRGKYVIGTVAGDVHDIGKNLVKMLLEGAEFEVIDLGVDVAVEDFVNAVSEHSPKILGLSALLTTTQKSMLATIEGLEESGLRQSVKIMVGGAPITASYAEEIGADGFAPDASAAVDVAGNLVKWR